MDLESIVSEISSVQPISTLPKNDVLLLRDRADRLEPVVLEMRADQAPEPSTELQPETNNVDRAFHAT
jgi:hypothetical protein